MNTSHLAILVAGILLSGCMTPRERFHMELMRDFTYVEQRGVDILRADTTGEIIGDCDDFAMAAWVRSGGACVPWHVWSPAGHHMVCRWPDGYYADNGTVFGSYDERIYKWITAVPTRTVKVEP